MAWLDAVVANAGFQHVSTVRDFPEDEWDKLLALLVTSPFLLAKYAWDALAASGDGRFLAVASVHGLVASPFKAGYVAAKHGVLGLVKTLALEGAADGIAATAVCPGYVRTPLVERRRSSATRRYRSTPNIASTSPRNLWAIESDREPHPIRRRPTHEMKHPRAQRRFREC